MSQNAPRMSQNGTDDFTSVCDTHRALNNERDQITRVNHRQRATMEATIIRAAVLAIVAFGAVGPAEATLTYYNDASLTIGVEKDTIVVGSGAVTIGSTSEGNFYLGEITLNGTVRGQHAEFSSVCTDLKGIVYVGSTHTFSEQKYDPLLAGLNPNWGASLSYAPQALQNAADIFFDHSSASSYVWNSTTYSRAQWWAAMQLAVWEELYDTGNGFSLDGGRFKATESAVTSDVFNLAKAWLVPANQTYVGDILIPLKPGSSDTGWVPDGLSGSNPGAQGMLYNVTPVPEASTLIAGAGALALTLLPLGARALRMPRRNRRPGNQLSL
jgi:hypothetical protein